MSRSVSLFQEEKDDSGSQERLIRESTHLSLHTTLPLFTLLYQGTSHNWPPPSPHTMSFCLSLKMVCKVVAWAIWRSYSFSPGISHGHLWYTRKYDVGRLGPRTRVGEFPAGPAEKVLDFTQDRNWTRARGSESRVIEDTERADTDGASQMLRKEEENESLLYLGSGVFTENCSGL